MARLPIPGGDNGNWGTVLNDYLSQAHSSDGSLKSGSVGAAQIQDNAVTSAALASGAVTNSTFAPGAITRAPVLFDPTNKNNGAVALVGTMDTGQLLIAFTNPLHAAAPLTLSGGVITHTTSGGGTSAGYMQADLGARVHRIGALISWPMNATGVVAIALPSTAWSSSGTFSNAGFHLVVQGHGIWSLTRYSAGGSTALASSSTHGRPHTVWGQGLVPIDIWIDTDIGRAVIRWWDGSQAVINSNYFKTETSNYAIWELFASVGGTDVAGSLGLLWASTEPVSADVYPNPLWQPAIGRSYYTTSGAISVDFSRANVHEITLNGNITSLSFVSPPADYQVYEVTFIQDVTGSRTLSGSTGIRWAGVTTPTLTATPNRRDTFRFRYSTGAWYEVSRSMNVG